MTTYLFLKKIILSSLILFLIPTTLMSQNHALKFDGINDYVDLGSSAGNNLRTIELWFNLDSPINSSLSNFSALVVRETASTTSNTNEFALSFQPSFVTNSGKLRFDIDGTLPFKSIYSNNSSWNANQWYHVAAVIHPTQGMMLFIDGVKQTSVHSHTNSPGTVSDITTIGQWGFSSMRHFKGKIDDVRFSSNAVYTSNFTPPCPDQISTTSTIGLWNFNANSGIIAIDSSSNLNNGSIYGASWTTASICAKGNALKFDGINDYVDLGSSVGNNLRTIELWFNLDSPINSSLSNFSALVVRETASTTSNTNEFALSFQPSFVTNSGKLRFDIDGTLPFKSIYSNNSSWNANQWYHVAAVIHPTQGMMLFIDGVKQTSVHSHTNSPGTVSDITTIGQWGFSSMRHFKGKIDDVRFSSNAVYTSNFTPPCPDQISTTSTIGLWNFNENSGNTVYDSSSNGNNGTLFGPQRINDSICMKEKDPNSVRELNLYSSFSVFPNPTNSTLTIKGNHKIDNVKIFTVNGKLVKYVNFKDRAFIEIVSVQDLPKGIYFIQIIVKNNLYNLKFIKS